MAPTSTIISVLCKLPTAPSSTSIAIRFIWASAPAPSARGAVTIPGVVWSGSRLAYLDAIVDYNRAQFELYVAMGQPPADTLARPVTIRLGSPEVVPEKK